MFSFRDSRLTYVALSIFFLIVLGYAYYEAQGILFGPSITVTSGMSEVREPFVLIKGQADRIASLSMNGETISVTETGAFEQPYLLAPGYNRVVLDAQDKYGRRSRKTIEIIYTPSSTTTPVVLNETATSSTFSTSSTPTP